MRCNTAGTVVFRLYFIRVQRIEVAFLKIRARRVRFFNKQKSDFAKQELGELIDMNRLNLYNIIILRAFCANEFVQNGT